MRFVTGTFIVASLMALSGCDVSLSQKEQTEHIRATPSIQNTAKNLSSSPYFANGNWPQKAWWEAFHSAELSNLITEALKKNPSIEDFNARVEAAKEQAIVTRSVLYPLIFFDGKATFQYLSQNGLLRALNPTLPLDHHPVDLSVALTYDFDFWHKNRNMFYAALGQAAAQEAEAKETELVISTSLAQVYFALKTNLIRKQLYQELYKVRRQIKSLQDLLLEKALASDFQPLLADEHLLAAEQFIADIDKEIAFNKHLINVLAGKNPDEPVNIQGNLPALPPKLIIPKNLPLDLLSRRPDLMTALWQAKALAYKTGAAKADFYPNINILSFLGLQASDYSKLFTAQSLTPAAIPALHLPIFTAGAISANIKSYKAQFDAAVYNYNDLLLKSVQEVLDILNFSQSVYLKKNEQDHIVSAAKERYDLSVLNEKSGLDSALDEYYYQDKLIQQQLLNINLKYNQYVSVIKLTKSLGGGYHAENVPFKETL